MQPELYLLNKHHCSPGDPALMGITQSSFDPASWFRFVQLIPHLEQAGWQIDHRPSRPDRQWISPAQTRLGRAVHAAAARILRRANRMRDLWDSSDFDVIFVHREVSVAGGAYRRLFHQIAEKTVFDLDNNDCTGTQDKQVQWMCANARWVMPSSRQLANYAGQFTDRVTIVPAIIDTDWYTARRYGADATDHTSPVRVGWIGSARTFGRTLQPWLATLRELQRVIDFELVVISNAKPAIEVEGLRWSFHPWRRAEDPLLESKIDIGIVPLASGTMEPEEWSLSLLQYMAAGLPVAASGGVSDGIIADGITGFVAATEWEWHQALKRLIVDRQARAAMGTAGRALCEEHHSIRRWLPVLLGIFETVRNERFASDCSQPV